MRVGSGGFGRTEERIRPGEAAQARWTEPRLATGDAPSLRARRGGRELAGPGRPGASLETPRAGGSASAALFDISLLSDPSERMAAEPPAPPSRRGRSGTRMHTLGPIRPRGDPARPRSVRDDAQGLVEHREHARERLAALQHETGGRDDAV